MQWQFFVNKLSFANTTQSTILSGIEFIDTIPIIAVGGINYIIYYNYIFSVI